jgi:DNA-binding transcriptional ArsR family regulator
MRSGLPAFAHSHRRACKALADPARVKIMSYLFRSSSGEENSGDLAAALRLTESTEVVRAD